MSGQYAFVQMALVKEDGHEQMMGPEAALVVVSWDRHRNQRSRQHRLARKAEVGQQQNHEPTQLLSLPQLVQKQIETG